MRLLGSKLDKKIKKAAAENESAWEDVGDVAQLKVWRIETFTVTPWPKEKYGQFHRGDSYIVYNSYRPDPSKPKLHHDIHIWIGDESSQDEYGTAAYKMVELDDDIGGVAVQHREVQSKESEKFMRYFNKKLTYLEGGIDTGFNHVEASVEEPHLYHLKGTNKGMSLMQVPVRRDSMNCGDVFILVAGEEHVWVWCGEEANIREKQRGCEVAHDFCKKGKVVTLNQGQDDGEEEAKDFWKYMPAHVSSFRASIIHEADDNDGQVTTFKPVLYKLPKKASLNNMKKVATAEVVVTGRQKQEKICKSRLKQYNGYVLDTGFHLFVWLGKEAEAGTKRCAVCNTIGYVKCNKRPELPLTIVKDGSESNGFNEFFYDAKKPKQSKKKWAFLRKNVNAEA